MAKRSAALKAHIQQHVMKPLQTMFGWADIFFRVGGYCPDHSRLGRHLPHHHGWACIHVFYADGWLGFNCPSYRYYYFTTQYH